MIRVFAVLEAEEVDCKAREFSKKVSFHWRDFPARVALPENRPYMMHYDGQKNCIDRIVRPYEIEVMEKDVFSEGIFSDNTSPWARFVEISLLSQNSEEQLRIFPCFSVKKKNLRTYNAIIAVSVETLRNQTGALTAQYL
jgi:hypothetical protein